MAKSSQAPTSDEMTDERDTIPAPSSEDEITRTDHRVPEEPLPFGHEQMQDLEGVPEYLTDLLRRHHFQVENIRAISDSLYGMEASSQELVLSVKSMTKVVELVLKDQQQLRQERAIDVVRINCMDRRLLRFEGYDVPDHIDPLDYLEEVRKARALVESASHVRGPESPAPEVPGT